MQWGLELKYVHCFRVAHIIVSTTECNIPPNNVQLKQNDAISNRIETAPNKRTSKDMIVRRYFPSMGTAPLYKLCICESFCNINSSIMLT